MRLSLSRRALRLGAIALAGTLFGASLAEAATFSVTGLYRDKRGTIELPLPPGLGLPAPGIPISGNASPRWARARPASSCRRISWPTRPTWPASWFRSRA